MPGSHPPLSNCLAARRRAGGFTLVEVLVAVIVVAVGLLGVAKLQAVGLSGSKNGRTRALAALQAESLAASITALPAFWAAAPREYTLEGAQVFLTGATAALVPPLDCGTTACAENDMALYDLQRWAAGMDAQFPGYEAQVACDRSSPRECTLRLSWNERVVQARTTPAASSAAVSRQSFVLHLMP